MNKINVWVGRSSFPVAVTTFPGGEVKVTLPQLVIEIGKFEARIEAILTSSNDVMALVMTVDALREKGCQKIRLTMPYVPYARQDRVCNVGEAFSIRAFAKIINALEFASVVIYDPHSRITSDLIDRCIVKSQADLMYDHVELLNYIEQSYDVPTYLVCPDAGAAKKIESVYEMFPQFNGIVYATKVREMSTGKILRTEISNPAIFKSMTQDTRFLIVDDITDGGRTFIEIAKAIEEYSPAARLSLYTTHGIYSAGMDVFKPYFYNVWSTINFKDYQ